jgi:hypothetical protein
MYDRQLWYCPITSYSIILTLYLDGSFLLEAAHLMDDYLNDLISVVDESCMDVEDFLDVGMNWIFLDHLPVLEVN